MGTMPFQIPSLTIVICVCSDYHSGESVWYNPFGTEARMFWLNDVINIAANALVPWVASSSAAMIITVTS